MRRRKPNRGKPRNVLLRKPIGPKRTRGKPRNVSLRPAIDPRRARRRELALSATIHRRQPPKQLRRSINAPVLPQRLVPLRKARIITPRPPFLFPTVHSSPPSKPRRTTPPRTIPTTRRALLDPPKTRDAPATKTRDTRRKVDRCPRYATRRAVMIQRQLAGGSSPGPYKPRTEKC